MKRLTVDSLALKFDRGRNRIKHLYAAEDVEDLACLLNSPDFPHWGAVTLPGSDLYVALDDSVRTPAYAFVLVSTADGVRSIHVEREWPHLGLFELHCYLCWLVTSQGRSLPSRVCPIVRDSH